MVRYKNVCTNDLGLQGLLNEDIRWKTKSCHKNSEGESNECDMRQLRHSPVPWSRLFRRLSNRTIARTINTTKRTAARDAATIIIVEELSLSSLLPPTPGAEEVKVESIDRDKVVNGS